MINLGTSMGKEFKGKYNFLKNIIKIKNKYN